MLAWSTLHFSSDGGGKVYSTRTGNTLNPAGIRLWSSHYLVITSMRLAVTIFTQRLPSTYSEPENRRNYSIYPCALAGYTLFGRQFNKWIYVAARGGALALVPISSKKRLSAYPSCCGSRYRDYSAVSCYSKGTTHLT